MSPDEREFGLLLGKVDALSEQVAELRRTNSAEHVANGQRFERLETSVRDALAGKASETWVKEHDDRIDSLEKTRDEGSGFAKLVKIGQGAATLGLMLLTYLAAKGGV